MGKRKVDLPIMIGKNLRKGLFAMRNSKIDGYDLWIIWLKKHYESGKQFDLKDIDKVDAVLHFCDRESVKRTINTLQWILDKGIEE